MKEVIIDVDEKGKVLSAKPITPNYNLVKPSQEDFYDVEDHNGNMDIIDTELKSQSQQITVCLGEIEKVREEIETAVGGIDLSSVNAHTTSVGAKTDTNVNRVGDYVAGIVTTSMRDINNNTDMARDNIKSHVTTEINRSIVNTGTKFFLPSSSAKVSQGATTLTLTPISSSSSTTKPVAVTNTTPHYFESSDNASFNLVFRGGNFIYL